MLLHLFGGANLCSMIVCAMSFSQDVQAEAHRGSSGGVQVQGNPTAPSAELLGVFQEVAVVAVDFDVARFVLGLPSQTFLKLRRAAKRGSP